MQRVSPDSDRRTTPLHAHPSVVALRARPARAAAEKLTLEVVRQVARAAGADDASVVSLDHPDLQEERPHVLAAMPDARTFVSFVVRTHADNVRSPKRTVANLEFHHAGQEVDEIARRIAMAEPEAAPGSKPRRCRPPATPQGHGR